MREGGQQMDKAAVIRMIAGNKCDVKDWKLEDPQMSKIDADTYVLSYKGTFDGSCTAPDGKSISSKPDPCCDCLGSNRRHVAGGVPRPKSNFRS